MKNLSKLLLMGSVILASAAALAQTPVQAPAAGAGRGAGRGAAPAIEWPPGYIDPAVPHAAYLPPETPIGTGPYKAIMASEPGAEEFVAYYPADLAALGAKKLPVAIWGNGGCSYTGNSARHTLQEIASHGYLVVAGGVMDNREQAENITMAANNAIQDPMAERPANAAPPPPPDPNRKAATVPLLSKGIDWVIAENKRQGSKFFGKLDTANLAVMGHSCGGGLASQFGNDPRVKTIILWSAWPGRITNDEFRNRLKKTTLIIAGDARYDISFYPALQAWEALRSTKTPVVYAWRTNMTHLGTYRQTDGGELAPIGIAWLDWQLKGDQSAAKLFKGVECGLCNQIGWHVQTRNID